MKHLLKKLDYYRNFPRFQLERHFDVILSEYITKIINHYEGTNFTFLFPEFPVRKSLLTNIFLSEMESVAFDYAIFDTQNKQVGIVELKTDTESNNAKQDSYLEKIKSSVTCNDLIQFINKRVTYRTYKRIDSKFEFLRNEMIENNCNFKSHTTVRTYKISPSNDKIPSNSYFSFEQIANDVKIKDEFWTELCVYLNKWDIGLGC
ncbi:MAG: hypothetical protein JEZ12_21910 [Desulfobacterium sp.]|nr:hypothetical protein [Desulfobacterium sp.]